VTKIANIELGDFPLLLAPMEDVSDPPFRILCREQGADLVYTEFISVEGLIRDASKSVKKLDVLPGERPVGIQIFGENIDSMRAATKWVERSEPELLDINYGCPVNAVACKGAGAGILKDIDKMERMTREIVQATHLPVTVKTRLGWDHSTIRIVEVALRLQDAGIKALTIHARTRAQMYKGESDWSWIQKVKEHPDIEIPIFGNGDIDTPQKALEFKNLYGVDGIMIGRAAIGYPWIFREIKHFFATGEVLPSPSIKERVETCTRHLLTSVDWKGEKLGILEMRRNYSQYFRGLAGIKELRSQMVTSYDLVEILELLDRVSGMEAKLEPVG
jgi:tRNA-dihydrouridine synthase B